MIDRERYRGALIRAQAENLVVGEMPTKLALGAEKRHACKGEIREIEYKGTRHHTKGAIAGAFFEYYKELFTPTSVHADCFNSDFISLMPRLDDERKEILEYPITEREVEKAIDKLNNGKSPGFDGLSAAVYKKFKDIISPILKEVFNKAFNCKQLPPSLLTACMVSIPKTEDPAKLRSITAYRPISLTNVDYKILMKILAKDSRQL